MQFDAFNFRPEVNQALATIGFENATPVQAQLIPLIQKGRDVVGESKTGSGKTHTFLLPIFDQLDSSLDQVQAVITAPSRELASQIYQASLAFVETQLDLRVANYIGGTDKARQIDKLSHKQPHLVIGTPGRIWDLIASQALRVHTARVFVVDEADMTLDMGFLKEVDNIASCFDKKVQMLVFSATIPKKLQPFLKKYLNQPEMMQIENKTVISDTVDNWLISTKGKQNNEILLQIIKAMQPYLAMIFANTKERADDIHHYLVNNGLKVAKIHGGVPARERKRIMKSVQNLDYQFLVATDLAARGIDIEGVSHVINDAIPRDLEFFIHRVGRTGRNQLSGTAITLYGPDDDRAISELEKLGIQFVPKAIRSGEFVDSYDRDRRDKRKKTTKDELDLTTRGALAKAKKKIKPGYKKKIGWDVEKRNKQKRKIERRASLRAARKSKKASS